jgi:hypothetical protein
MVQQTPARLHLDKASWGHAIWEFISDFQKGSRGQKFKRNSEHAGEKQQQNLGG